MHFVFVGNGVLSLTTAFRLLKRLTPADRISMIGEPTRVGSATLAAAAMLNSFAEVESGSLASELDRYRFELSRQATRLWPEFLDDLLRASGDSLRQTCAPCGSRCKGFSDQGTYVINNTAADDLDDENFDAMVSALSTFGEPHTFVSPGDIPNYLPDQRQRATRAVMLPNEGWMNPRLTMDLLDAVLSRFPNLERVQGTVERLEGVAGRVAAAVLTDGRRVEGDEFLLATGASATDILNRSELGLRVQRVFYGVGVSLEIRSPDYPHTQCIRTPNRGLACGVYTVPYIGGPDSPHEHILVGATNFISPTPYPFGRLTSVESLMRAAMEQINRNFYRADLVRVNVGWRPTSQDTFPLIGRTSVPNLVVATGTKRDGFHLSPVLSEYITSMLMGVAVDSRFAVFAPERAPIRQLTREQAISRAVRHQINASYQHDYAPAKGRMAHQVEAMFRSNLEKLHDKVGAHDWGIPVEMLDMYRYGHAVAS